ncbi:hypothetical protein [Sphingobacterium sp.]|uniref:hypothetical protein n=1 Tax=Sphingobacterium sp. TaxID=341027 RepID=UPI0028A24E88|nr:hypothetical protein [Sphingobacterium sp.]
MDDTILLNEFCIGQSIAATELVNGTNKVISRSYYQPQIGRIRDYDDYERIAYIVNCLRNYRDSATYIHNFMANPNYIE